MAQFLRALNKRGLSLSDHVKSPFAFNCDQLLSQVEWLPPALAATRGWAESGKQKQGHPVLGKDMVHFCGSLLLPWLLMQDKRELRKERGHTAGWGCSPKRPGFQQQSVLELKVFERVRLSDHSQQSIPSQKESHSTLPAHCNFYSANAGGKENMEKFITEESRLCKECVPCELSRKQETQEGSCVSN